MEVPATVLEVLKCSSCEAYLSRGPVYLQHDGAGVCGRCFSPKRAAATRNTQHEATAALLLFPCKYRELGCRDTVPFAREKEELAHEEVCAHRQYVCPVVGSARCDWLGPRAAMLAHCRDQHPDSVLENPCSLTHDIAKASLQNYIVTAFQLLFLLHTKVCVATGKLYHAVRLLGSTADAANYCYTLDIKRGDELLSKKGQVAPQGCLAIQEDTSLVVDTNSLLDVLGGFDGATFTLSVKRRVSDTTDELTKRLEWLAKDVVACVMCEAAVTVFRYCDRGDWLCERCAPVIQACNNQDKGCSYTDIEDKCIKHELYFCQHTTSCSICQEDVSEGSLSAHYESVHQDVMRTVGYTWRATYDTQYTFLVPSVAGTAMCSFKLDSNYDDDLNFSLSVYIPVSSERLREFRCVVRLIDSITGHTRTYTPDIVYNDNNDWNILVEKEELSKTGALNVSIDINKID